MNGMKLDLSGLAANIRPSNTILLLGAGASIPSGAPSGASLAKQLAGQLKPPPDADDLADVCGIYERRQGRTQLARAVQSILEPLRPTGGLLALPALPWRAIYSTNFDRLVELSYRAADKDLSVVRSNYDFSTTDNDGATKLYKIHGCMTQDTGLGHKAQMVLTERDYDDVAQYRQALFNSLKSSMMTNNTLVVGQSLRDAHLRSLAKEVGVLRQTQGGAGRVFLLVYDYDEDRAPLFEQYGIEVVGGSLNDLIFVLQKEYSLSALGSDHDAIAVPIGDSLPEKLLATTTNAEHASTLEADVAKLFNGSPATYADIQNGFTIERGSEHRLRTAQDGRRGFFLVISGGGGVGKTSLARRLLHKRISENFLCWEHIGHFPLDVDSWLLVDSELKKSGRQGILLIDDCARHFNAVNRLATELAKRDRPFLRLVMTVNAAQWSTRTKSPAFFTHGSLERVSILSNDDVDALVNLVDSTPAVRSLVEADFLGLGRQDRVRRLRERCSSEMFVCLKNIFHTESLDNILLQEYADLEVSARDVYRHVSALQAMGVRVHRQLIVRLLGIEAGTLQGLLAYMDAVVSEYDISDRDGLYGWTTRHDVIAKVIATYKYSDQDELYGLLVRLIDGLNPTVHIELETARAIAADEMGIARLSNYVRREELLKKLIGVVPAERTPRRRLIRLFLDGNDLVAADSAIVAAKKSIGSDPIVERYNAVLAYRRAINTEGILDEDRVAMLKEAERIARQCVVRNPLDRYNFRTLSDVAVELLSRTGKSELLVETIDWMKREEADAADPDFVRDRRGLEQRLRQFGQDFEPGSALLT
jgi:GTPase SAR1 family protein